jgi:hypothetical protein
MDKSKPLIAFVLILIVGVAIGGFFLLRPGDDSQLEVSQGPQGNPTSGDSMQADSDYVMVGGVRRRASDVRRAKPEPDEIAEEEDEASKTLGYGKTPKVPLGANPNVKSAVEAIKSKKFPERLTPMIAPKPFDPKAYAENPQAYLDVVEPGRAFAPAAPGKGIPRLRRISPYFQKVAQGGSVKLRASAKPGAPVTFTSLDLGQFSNQLTSITVAANDQGVAEAEFTATPGTIEDVRIIAAGPATSGQMRFIVNVSLPSKTAE